MRESVGWSVFRERVRVRVFGIADCGLKYKPSPPPLPEYREREEVARVSTSSERFSSALPGSGRHGRPYFRSLSFTRLNTPPLSLAIDFIRATNDSLASSAASPGVKRIVLIFVCLSLFSRRI